MQCPLHVVEIVRYSWLRLWAPGMAKITSNSSKRWLVSLVSDGNNPVSLPTVDGLRALIFHRDREVKGDAKRSLCGMQWSIFFLCCLSWQVFFFICLFLFRSPARFSLQEDSAIVYIMNFDPQRDAMCSYQYVVFAAFRRPMLGCCLGHAFMTFLPPPFIMRFISRLLLLEQFNQNMLFPTIYFLVRESPNAKPIDL